MVMVKSFDFVESWVRAAAPCSSPSERPVPPRAGKRRGCEPAPDLTPDPSAPTRCPAAGLR